MKHPVPLKVGKVLEQLSDWRLLKEGLNSIELAN
jgi:hypothetical protein